MDLAEMTILGYDKLLATFIYHVYSGYQFLSQIC
jgi:hypothetical protein